MDSILILTFIKDNPLALFAVIVSIIFIYHYIIEKEHGVKLTKKYRNSIFEAQSKIFLNATHYLINGNKDLAIKEFLNAVDLNRETLETYFALGKLFRSNGEIEKAISIHRSLIARDNINESTRLRALKELAVDFDKGGFVDKAIETYKDVLKVNRDQNEVILSLCRIFEDTEDWDQAYNYRVMLSKVGHENQSQTISHILVEKAKHSFAKGEFKACHEILEDAFKFAPSVSAMILRLKLYILQGDMDQAKTLLIELLKEHPMYGSFIFVSLDEFADAEKKEEYLKRLDLLKEYFLTLEDPDFDASPSIVLSKIRMLKDKGREKEAYNILKTWVKEKRNQSEVLNVEYIKLLISLNEKDEAISQTGVFLNSLHSNLTRHYCSNCGFNSDNIFWRCPQCHTWETIQFRMKV